MKTKRIECLMERLFRESGFVLVHDGQERRVKEGAVPFPQPPEEVRFFTRQYRKMVNGKFMDEWVVFRYDLRDGFCVECNVTTKEPDGKRHQQRLVQKEMAK